MAVWVTVALIEVPDRVVEDADVEIQGVEERRLLEVVQHPSVRRPVIVVERRRADIPVEEVRQGPRREAAIRLVVIVQRQADLLEVVGALESPCRLAGRLHRGEQQRDQHRDDRDGDQELNQGESTRAKPGTNDPKAARRATDGRRAHSCRTLRVDVRLRSLQSAPRGFFNTTPPVIGSAVTPICIRRGPSNTVL